MARIDKTPAAMRNAPQNISDNDLHSVCGHFFGEPRQSGTSHAVFKTPWPGDPRVNIQKSKDGKAKPYQVRQALKAIDKRSRPSTSCTRSRSDRHQALRLPSPLVC